MSKMTGFSTSIVWYHRDISTPEKGHRILVYSPMYEIDDPFRIRILDSQFYHLSTDAEWWAYINEPQLDIIKPKQL